MTLIDSSQQQQQLLLQQLLTLRRAPGSTGDSSRHLAVFSLNCVPCHSVTTLPQSARADRACLFFGLCCCDIAVLTPLSLQLQDVECFRYRIEDVRRGLTKRVVAAAVARDLQQQLLNSGKLKEFFERNPRDREVLKRACKQLKVIQIAQD